MNPLDLPDGYRALIEAVSAALAPKPRLTVSEWADENRVLTSAESSEPGPWRTDRVPYMREIMECLSPTSPVQRVVFMKPTQVAGTEAIINWVGAVVALYPSPMLVVQPTIEVAELFSKQRIANMINACKVLRDKIAPARNRDSGNTTLLKEFAGGALRMAGANSAKSLRSMPVRFLALDEVDGYEDDVDGEGDPVGLAEERTNNFPLRKVFLNSTPTIKGASRIEKEYDASDQRRYYVPCPHCDELQTLKWPNLQWNDTVTRAWYVCEHNGCVIEEHHKPAMLAAGQWIATYPERDTRGYHLNSLYSPIGLGRTWLERVKQWIAAQGELAQLKRFVNTALAETWEDRSNAVKANALQARAEPFKLRTVPVGCLVLTLGVDTQDDRLECQLLGWGRGETCWVLDYHVIHGSPALDETWDKLSAYRRQPLRNQYGIDMRVQATAIDSGGHHTHDVYNYSRLWQHERVFAIKGVSTPNKAVLGKPTLQDVDYKGAMQKNGVQLWPVGTDTAKSALFGRLIADGDTEVVHRKVRFSADLPLDYYEQLTAEAFDPERNRWVKRKGKRNEALDTWVYGYAAAQHPDIRVHVARDVEWAQLENLLQPRVGDLFTAQPDPPRAQTNEVTVPAVSTPTPPTPPDGGVFVSGADDGWLDQRTDNWLE